jgi:prophage regulatory protein
VLACFREYACVISTSNPDMFGIRRFGLARQFKLNFGALKMSPRNMQQFNAPRCKTSLASKPHSWEPAHMMAKTLTNNTPRKPRRLIRLPEVLHRTGMSRSGLYNRIGLGLFPTQIKLGQTSVWLESDVDAWIEGVVAAHCRTGEKAS